MVRREKIPATSSEQRDTYHHGDLKRALTEAALGLVSEKGPKGFTLREVARRAGVSAAAPSTTAITDGPVSLPDAVAMLDTAYLGHVIVLLVLGPHAAQPRGRRIHHRPHSAHWHGLRPRNRRPPFRLFTEPITTLAGAAKRDHPKPTSTSSRSPTRQLTRGCGPNHRVPIDAATTPLVERGY